MPKSFEAGIYNQQVRDALKNGDRHKNLKDEWADTHYIPITAESREDAMRQLQRRYPASAGYRINDLYEVPAARV